MLGQGNLIKVLDQGNDMFIASSLGLTVRCWLVVVNHFWVGGLEMWYILVVILNTE